MKFAAVPFDLLFVFEMFKIHFLKIVFFFLQL